MLECEIKLFISGWYCYWEWWNSDEFYHQAFRRIHRWPSQWGDAINVSCFQRNSILLCTHWGLWRIRWLHYAWKLLITQIFNLCFPMDWFSRKWGHMLNRYSSRWFIWNIEKHVRVYSNKTRFWPCLDCIVIKFCGFLWEYLLFWSYFKFECD